MRMLVLAVRADGQGALEVDFAPYQKVPREKQRKDAKMGTIDRDPEYLAFLEELAKPKEVRTAGGCLTDDTESVTANDVCRSASVETAERRGGGGLGGRRGGRGETCRGARQVHERAQGPQPRQGEGAEVDYLVDSVNHAPVVDVCVRACVRALSRARSGRRSRKERSARRRRKERYAHVDASCCQVAVWKQDHVCLLYVGRAEAGQGEVQDAKRPSQRGTSGCERMWCRRVLHHCASLFVCSTRTRQIPTRSFGRPGQRAPTRQRRRRWRSQVRRQLSLAWSASWLQRLLRLLLKARVLQQRARSLRHRPSRRTRGRRRRPLEEEPTAFVAGTRASVRQRKRSLRRRTAKRKAVKRKWAAAVLLASRRTRDAVNREVAAVVAPRRRVVVLAVVPRRREAAALEAKVVGIGCVSRHSWAPIRSLSRQRRLTCTILSLTEEEGVRPEGDQQPERMIRSGGCRLARCCRALTHRLTSARQLVAALGCDRWKGSRVMLQCCSLAAARDGVRRIAT